MHFVDISIFTAKIELDINTVKQRKRSYLYREERLAQAHALLLCLLEELPY
jgi:hypothetical protein